MMFFNAIFIVKLRRLLKSRNYWREQGIAGPEQQLLLGNTLQFSGGIENFDKENIARFGKTFG